MSEAAEIRVRLDKDAAMFELEELERAADRVVEKSKRTIETVREDMRVIDRTVNMSVSMVRNLLQMVGQTLDPMASAILNVIEVNVQSLYRVAVMWGSTGYGLPLAIAMFVASATLSLWSVSAVSQGMDQAKSQIQGAIGLTQNFQSLLSGLGRR